MSICPSPRRNIEKFSRGPTFEVRLSCAPPYREQAFTTGGIPAVTSATLRGAQAIRHISVSQRRAYSAAPVSALLRASLTARSQKADGDKRTAGGAQSRRNHKIEAAILNGNRHRLESSFDVLSLSARQSPKMRRAVTHGKMLSHFSTSKQLR